MGNLTTTQPALCTCCTPARPLVQLADGTAAGWYCTATLNPYTLQDDVVVALPTTPGPWDEGSAGAAPARAVRIDLSQAGYS